jgi:3'-phosphoadenosine 5'-phosphosulfate sulfotransferase (PAPS reductase)/FAD synthetase
MSFNGGKDAMVMLYLVRRALLEVRAPQHTAGRIVISL